MSALDGWYVCLWLCVYVAVCLCMCVSTVSLLCCFDDTSLHVDYMHINCN